jgi:hypothetical protein
MAASVRVKTVWSIGSTITTVLASTLCIAGMLDDVEVRSRVFGEPFLEVIVRVDEVLK